MELDPKHVLRNKALREGNLELYSQIDEYKREAAQMYFNIDQESHIEEDLVGEEAKDDASSISNEFWDSIEPRTQFNRASSGHQLRRPT